MVGVLLMLVSFFGFMAACHAKKGEDDMEEDPKAATLSYSIMRDGGNEIVMTIDDESLVEYTTKEKSNSEKGAKGGSSNRTYIFTGKKSGTTSLTVEEYFHGDLDSTTYYIITVDDDLKVTITKDEDREDPKKMPVLVIGDREILVKVEKNESAELFFGEKSCNQSLGYMKDVDGNEKGAWLDRSFSDEEIQTVEVVPGDLICCNKTTTYITEDGEEKETRITFAIVYAPHTTECVVIGHLQDIDQDELTDLLNQDMEKELHIPNR